MSPSESAPITVVVIPCLNEERFIRDVVRRAVEHVDKVIVIDDGSTDKTSEVAAGSGAEVIKHPARLGAGAATRTGFQAAQRYNAGIVVTLDGDGQHDPDEIPLLIRPVQDGAADIVIGSRFLRTVQVPVYRKFGIDVITWLYNLGRKEKIVDAQSGFRAYGRKALDLINIRYDGFAFSIQTLVQARSRGLKICEVPVSCIYHDYGSSQNPLVHGLNVALAVLKIRLEEELFTPRKT